MTIAKMIEIADKLNSSKIGYDQSERWSHLDRRGKKIIPNKEGDCSATCGTVMWLGGYPIVLTGVFYTGNIVAKAKESGYFKIISVKGWSQKKLFSFLKPGDTMQGTGHVIFVREGGPNGKWLSFENDEHGKSAGGTDGKQAGEHVGYRKPYMRSRGWSYVIRPYPSSKYRGEILNQFETGKGSYSALLTKLTNTAPIDAPMWARFMADWSMLDLGMKLAYSPEQLASPSTGSHAFVILGSGLKSDGSLPVKMLRRLKLVKAASDRFPDSKIIVSGGAPKNGVTEAEIGAAWLKNQGVAEDRIIQEAASSSTIGNAKNSVALMLDKKITSYTLVSDASHLRRAQVLFNAAVLAHDTAINKKSDIKPLQALAFNDYGSKPVSTEKISTQTTRSAIVKEVAYVLDLTVEWLAAKQ